MYTNFRTTLLLSYVVFTAVCYFILWAPWAVNLILYINFHSSNSFKLSMFSKFRFWYLRVFVRNHKWKLLRTTRFWVPWIFSILSQAQILNKLNAPCLLRFYSKDCTLLSFLTSMQYAAEVDRWTKKPPIWLFFSWNTGFI